MSEGEMKNLRFDRTITLSIIFAISIQTAGALMWAGAAEARLSDLESRAEQALPVSERLARLEEQMSMARESLSRIEQRLDKQADN
jgi:anti-sigma-K factor RskA